MSEIPIKVVRLEDLGPDAYSWVMSCWMRSYLDTYAVKVMGRGAPKHMTRADRKAYYAAYHPYAMGLLAESTTLVAHMANDPDAFVGWACGVPGHVHYAFTKRGPYRQDGVASRLVKQVAGDSGTYGFLSLSKAVPIFEDRGWMYLPHDSPMENDNGITADDDRDDDPPEASDLPRAEGDAA